MKQREIGNLGEAAVCEWLQGQGYRIVARNYRIRGGEVDIIAEKGEYLAFVEVKTRKQGSMISPLESVTKHQQACIIRTAIAYCAEYNADWQRQPRYDIASVILSGTRVVALDYLENAFDTTGFDEI